MHPLRDEPSHHANSPFSPYRRPRYVASWIKTLEVSGMARRDATKNRYTRHTEPRREDERVLCTSFSMMLRHSVKRETRIFKIIKNIAAGISRAWARALSRELRKEITYEKLLSTLFPLRENLPHVHQFLIKLQIVEFRNHGLSHYVFSLVSFNVYNFQQTFK